ncbi:hypothetical protein D3C75_1243380 [compost metagenome]
MHPILTQAQKDEIEQQIREEINVEGSLKEWNEYIGDCGSDAIRLAWKRYGTDNPELDQLMDDLMEKFENEGL